MSQPVLAGFVDVGFIRAVLGDLRGVQRASVRVNASAVAALVQQVAAQLDTTVLRTYWYDGQLSADDPRSGAQRRYLDAVSRVPGIHLRLGHLVERVPPWYPALLAAMDRLEVDRAEFARVFPVHNDLVQKGVDTLMAVDLVSLAHRGALGTACLLTGDRDLEPALDAAQGQGARVVLLAPPGRSVSGALRRLADEVIPLTEDRLRALDLSERPARATPIADGALAPETAVTACPLPAGHLAL